MSCLWKRNNFLKITKGYQKHCSCKCAAKDDETIKTRENTVFNKTGCINVSQTKENKAKVTAAWENMDEEKYKRFSDRHKELWTLEILKQGMIKKYGVESVLELEKRIENLKKTNTEKGINNFKINLEENYTWIEYLGDYKHLIKCNLCETEFKCSYPQLFTYRNKLCPICYKRTAHVSSYEDEIYEYLKSILPNEEILRNYRKSLKRKELDFYIKNLNCAIEFDGIYWHMDSRFHSADEINERVHLTAQQIWDRDKEKDLLCETKKLNC